jgi:hypothetical protein
MTVLPRRLRALADLDPEPMPEWWPWTWWLASFGVLAAGWFVKEHSVPGGLELEALLYMFGFYVLLGMCFLANALVLVTRGPARFWVAAAPFLVSLVGTLVLVQGT